MGFWVADWGYECVDTVVFAVKVKIGPYNSHVSYITNSTDPKLHRIFTWGMKCKCFGPMIIMRLSLNPFHIRSMRQLCQRKPPNILQSRCSFRIHLMPFSPQIRQRPRVQEQMNPTLNTISIIIIDICTANQAELVRILEELIK